MGQLHRDWERLLKAALKEQGLEDALTRPPDIGRETALTWQEMRHLKQVLGETFGHEYKLSHAQITAWRDAGKITQTEAAWLSQRGEKQRVHQREQQRHKQWEAHHTLETARPWHVVTKYQARKTVQDATRTISDLERRRRDIGQVAAAARTSTIVQGKTRYAREKAQERRRLPGRGRGQEPTRGGPGLRVYLGETPEEQLERLRRARQRDMEMER